VKVKEHYNKNSLIEWSHLTTRLSFFIAEISVNQLFFLSLLFLKEFLSHLSNSMIEKIEKINIGTKIKIIADVWLIIYFFYILHVSSLSLNFLFLS
jgi:hypothetical protein